MGTYCSVNDLESILLKMACRDTDREIVMIYMCMMCVCVCLCTCASSMAVLVVFTKSSLTSLKNRKQANNGSTTGLTVAKMATRCWNEPSCRMVTFTVMVLVGTVVPRDTFETAVNMIYLELNEITI